jgi:hypothetical protein
MSLQQLRALRRGGNRPPQVTVLIGRPYERFEDGAAYVVVDAASDADLSPLVGLPVHVLDLQADTALTLRTIATLEGLGVKPLGICGPAGSCGVSPEHEQSMESLRRLLCGN